MHQYVVAATIVKNYYVLATTVPHCLLLTHVRSVIGVRIAYVPLCRTTSTTV
jgi:hypothetical protein